MIGYIDMVCHKQLWVMGYLLTCWCWVCQKMLIGCVRVYHKQSGAMGYGHTCWCWVAMNSSCPAVASCSQS